MPFASDWRFILPYEPTKRVPNDGDSAVVLNIFNT